MDDPSIYLEFLGKHVEVLIDRPLGSVHPDIPALVYQTNYGYIPGTLAGDGEEIDAYVVGVDEPAERFSGHCIAVVVRKNDDENKLVVAAQSYPVERIAADIDYVERDFDTEIITLRGR